MLIIKLSEFLSTSHEIHAFIIGICETLSITRAHHIMPQGPPDPLIKEYHYYMTGRACGVVLLLVIIACLVKWTIGG